MSPLMISACSPSAPPDSTRGSAPNPDPPSEIVPRALLGRAPDGCPGTSGRVKAEPLRGRLRRALTRPENPKQGQACPTEEIPLNS
jgi:hypothetical protein